MSKAEAGSRSRSEADDTHAKLGRLVHVMRIFECRAFMTAFETGARLTINCAQDRKWTATQTAVD